MARDTLLDRTDLLLPYWVLLDRLDGDTNRKLDKARPTMMHLDFSGGEASRATSNRLADTFNWLTRAFNIRRDDLTDYGLMCTALPCDPDTGAITAPLRYVPEDRPQLRERSFHWVPVPYDEHDRRHVWQR